MQQISSEELSKRIESESIHIVDVREDYEYEEGHINGTIHIPLGDLESRKGELDQWKADPIIVYCKSGMRSAMAQQILTAAGFTEVVNLVGGYEQFSSLYNK